MAVLDNPTLEFRRSDGSWSRAGLGSLSVGTATLEIDLARYKIVGAAGAPPQMLATALVAFRMTDAASAVARSSSAVSVTP